MKYITKTLAGIVSGCCLASSIAQAAPIQSMTIGEIGLLTGGLGTSNDQNNGGNASAYSGSGSFGSASFVSLGSTDGSLLMGQIQGPGDFSNGFLWQNQTAYLTTLNGAPSGAITNNIMTLDVSGFTGEWNGVSFSGTPDPGTLATTASLIGNGVYFYTADWTHLVTSRDGVPALYYGITLDFHLEGIAITALAAPIPEPESYAMFLVGLGLVGLMAHRRQNRRSKSA